MVILMPKIAIRGKDVINLGGWVLEHRAKLPYRDYVIGNPFDEPVKAIEELGLIVEPVSSYDKLTEKLKKVKALIESSPPPKE
jgi:hypothetical protein